MYSSFARNSLALFLLVIELVLNLIPEAFAEKRTIIATAYYSPVPGQSYYLRGNYEADVRLNGNGTHGASGVAVHPGMIAAPKTYAFGTKIVIPGMGTGTVYDRGGAIVKAGERGYSYDRIDIWMGYGETGLARALAWGKRTIDVDVIEAGTGTIFELKENKAGTFTIAGLPLAKLPKTASGQTLSGATLSGSVAMKTTLSASSTDITHSGAIVLVNSTIFGKAIDEKSSNKDIRELSSALLALGYLEGKIRDTYNPDMKMAVANFQLDNGLVVDIDDDNLGVYGKRTAKILGEKYTKKISEQNQKLTVAAKK